MALARQLKALLKSHAKGDDERFYSLALQLAANEATIFKDVFKILALLLFGTITLPIQALASTETMPTLRDLETYLEGIDTLYSEILQINSDGSKSEGYLIMDRPLRARLEYDPPDKGIIIARSGSVAIFDKGSNTGPTIYPLRHTPFYHLLTRKMNFNDSETVIEHLIGSEYNELHLKVNSEQVGGHLELVFQNEPLQLEGWVFVDEFGNRTLVQLINIQTNIKIDQKLFNIELQKEVLNLP